MTSRRDVFHRPIFLALALFAGVSCAQDSAPPNPLVAARDALALGNPVAARGALQTALSEGAARSDVAAYMGEAALLDSDLAEAHEWLDAAEFSPATSVLGWRMRGRLAVAEGQLAAAGQAYDQALARGGKKSSALWVDIARLRYAGGEQLGAIEAAEKALTLDRRSAEALRLQAQLLSDSVGPEPAIGLFAEAMAANPADVALKQDFAAALGDAGHAGQALDLLLEDASPRSQYLLAIIAARGGNLPLARTLLQRSDEERRSSAAARLVLAIADLEDGNSASAAQALGTLARELPDNLIVRDLAAVALARNDEHRLVVDRFADLARSPAGSAYLRALVGRSYEALGDRQSAAPFLDSAARAGGKGFYRLKPSHQQPSGALVKRDRIRSTGRLEDARAFRRLYPGSADGEELLGDALVMAGQLKEARAAFARAANVRQSMALAQRRMAIAETPEAAVAILENYVRGHPLSGLASAQLADAYAAQGRWDAAAVLLDHAAANGMGRVPWVAAARALAALRTGDSEAALAHALYAYELQPQNGDAVAALLAALPASEAGARLELTIKLAGLKRN